MTCYKKKKKKKNHTKTLNYMKLKDKKKNIENHYKRVKDAIKKFYITFYRNMM